MLKKTTLTKIAGLLKIDAARLEAAIASKVDEDLDIADDLTVYNKTELEAYKKNISEQGKTNEPVKATKSQEPVTDKTSEPDKKPRFAHLREVMASIEKEGISLNGEKAAQIISEWMATA